MAEVFQWRPLSENVAIFKLKGGPGENFPEYRAGQNIELYRRHQAVIFSIASAPQQTKRKGFLEFFVNADNFFHNGEAVRCAERASGNFTLERTTGFDNVVFVATGTGIAPFISMIRELSYSSRRHDGVRYTLIHGSRKYIELGYHKELAGIVAAGKLDLLYVPTVSRPFAGDWNQRSIGKGRAGNILRLMLRLPLKGDAVLPEQCLAKEHLRNRFQRRSTIILACGSHASVADIKSVAAQKQIRFEKEDW